MTGAHDAWRRGADFLAAAGIDGARLDARVLLAHALGIDTGALPGAAEPSADELARYRELLERRAAHEPVAYITGAREFWSLPFAVGPGVLVPRPETETLVEEACPAFPDRKAALDVADFGTGSGCLLLAVLTTFPNARGTGIDASPEALSWARRNADALGVADRCRFLQGSWETALGERFDLVLSNPPYVARREAASLAPDVARYEPPEALYGGEDGLAAYRALAPVIAAVLKPDGLALLEIGAGQASQVRDILARAGLCVTAEIPDLGGIPRCIAARPSRGDFGPCAEKTLGNRPPSH